MNEVTKLYENAGVEKDWNSTPYGGIEEYYPPFTAEKQLELIKWLSKFNLRIEQPDYAKGYYFIETHTGIYSKFLPIFEEALAKLINSLWQDLTDADKAQIKEILE